MLSRRNTPHGLPAGLNGTEQDKWIAVNSRSQGRLMAGRLAVMDVASHLIGLLEKITKRRARFEHGRAGIDSVAA
jgi:hypothetical protein